MGDFSDLIFSMSKPITAWTLNWCKYTKKNLGGQALQTPDAPFHQILDPSLELQNLPVLHYVIIMSRVKSHVLALEMYTIMLWSY